MIIQNFAVTFMLLHRATFAPVKLRPRAVAQCILKHLGKRKCMNILSFLSTLVDAFVTLAERTGQFTYTVHSQLPGSEDNVKDPSFARYVYVIWYLLAIPNMIFI
jgi:hypothetical protein